MEQEQPPIRITAEDIREANQLSLHCPICASPVEREVTEAALRPVACTKCHTLYHHACWEQSGGKCAILGCTHDEYVFYGEETSPILKIEYKDLTHPLNGRLPSRSTKHLKDEQRRQVEQLRRPSLLRRLWQWLLDQIKID